MNVNTAEEKFDLIVIGAGINGAGIARDAVMRGLKVLLLDKGDIGCGTSSASTRLIHGGLRYLEHAEPALVRQSLREREILLRIAPHLVRPLPILVPVYKSGRRSLFTIRAGMIAYDLLSLGKSLPRHRMLSKADVLQSTPGLRADGLLGAALYFDCQVAFAERLVLENVLSAKEHGAAIQTYTKVTSISTERGRITGLEFTDELTGESGRALASIVVNATGPWVDQVLRESVESTQHLIGGTKGSHIVVGPFDSAPRTALYVEAEMDHRPFFVIPWNDQFLIGTTDVRYEGDPDRVMIDEGEIHYLLHETNRLFPTANLKRESILFSYSGVRPLAYSERGSESSITRRHFLCEQKEIEGLISIVGGKLTTYRQIAEEAVDLIEGKLGRRLKRCATAEEPLPGAVNPSVPLQTESGLPAETLRRLLRIYGNRTAGIIKLTEQDHSLRQPFDEETGALAAEIVYAFEQELGRTLGDCLLRRTMVGFNSSMGLDSVSRAAEVACQYLGWSEVRAAKEIMNYRETIERFRPGTTAMLAES